MIEREVRVEEVAERCGVLVLIAVLDPYDAGLVMKPRLEHDALAHEMTMVGVCKTLDARVQLVAHAFPEQLNVVIALEDDDAVAVVRDEVGERGEQRNVSLDDLA